MPQTTGILRRACFATLPSGSVPAHSSPVQRQAAQHPTAHLQARGTRITDRPAVAHPPVATPYGTISPLREGTRSLAVGRVIHGSAVGRDEQLHHRVPRKEAMNDQNDHDFTGGLQGGSDGLEPQPSSVPHVDRPRRRRDRHRRQRRRLWHGADRHSSGGTAKRRAAPAPPATRCSWPASSGGRRRASTRWQPPRLADRRRPEPVHLRDPAAVQPARRLAAAGPGQEVEQPDDNTIVLPLQDGTKWHDGSDLTADDVVFTFELGKTARQLLHGLALHRLDHRDRRPDGRVQAEDRAVQPELRQELPVHHLDRAEGRVQQDLPGQDPVRDQPQAVGSGPYKLDKYDQTQVNLTRDDNYWGKTVFGTPADDHHQPPDLQEQQRRRPQAGERRDRRQPAVHRADLEDVGGRASRSAPG